MHGPFTALETLQDGLRSRGWSVQDWGHQWHPLNSIDLQQSDQARQCLQLLDALEALDDVRSVSCNLGRSPSWRARVLGAEQTAAEAIGCLHRLLPVLRFAHT